MREEFLWTELYRPRTVEDVILPARIKDVFLGFIAQNNLPNLLLHGTPGVGKTTIAMAVLDQLGVEYIKINGSKDGNIDTLRNKVQNFASSVSFNGKRKFVLFDEADWINVNSTQPALRAFMEEFSNNCGFIFTCNYQNRIMTELHSRFAMIDFRLLKTEKVALAKEMIVKSKQILTEEGVTFDAAAVAQLVAKYFPDFRRAINEMHSYAMKSNRVIDSGILATFKEIATKQLFDDLKKQNFTSIRKWVGENSDIDQLELFRKIYQMTETQMTPAGQAASILLLSDHINLIGSCPDPEINIMACLTKVMINAEWK